MIPFPHLQITKPLEETVVAVVGGGGGGGGGIFALFAPKRGKGKFALFSRLGWKEKGVTRWLLRLRFQSVHQVRTFSSSLDLPRPLLSWAVWRDRKGQKKIPFWAFMRGRRGRRRRRRMGKTKPEEKWEGPTLLLFDGTRELLYPLYTKKVDQQMPRKKGRASRNTQKFLWVKISWSLTVIEWW